MILYKRVSQILWSCISHDHGIRSYICLLYINDRINLSVIFTFCLNTADCSDISCSFSTFNTWNQTCFCNKLFFNQSLLPSDVKSTNAKFMGSNSLLSDCCHGNLRLRIGMCWTYINPSEWISFTVPWRWIPFVINLLGISLLCLINFPWKEKGRMEYF